MGIAYMFLEKFEEALNAFEMVLKINPKDNNIYYNLGLVYINLEKYEKGIEYTKKDIELNPLRGESYYNLGLGYINLEKYEKSIEYTKKSIKLGYKNYQAYLSCASAYYLLKEYSQTIQFLIETLNVNPKQDAIYTNLFELQLTQNQAFDQALEANYLELFQNQKESFIKYEMLKIFQAIARGETVDIEAWKQKYDGVGLDWGFDELREWIEGFDEGEVKARLFEALAFFEGRGAVQ